MIDANSMGCFSLHFLVLFMTVTVICLLNNVQCDSTAHEWSYDKMSDWSTYFPRCNGTEQSPINIIDDEAIAVAKAGKLHFKNYHQPMRVVLVNNGKTVKLSSIFINNLTVSGLGMYLQNIFTLQQVHFHWGETDTSGSEHRINGKGSAMEVHFVHFNSEKYSDISKAQSHVDGILVIAVLVEVSNKASFKTVWKNLTYELHNILQPGLKTSMPNKISLEQLLPKNRDNFYFYRGSFTTPACFQSVTWVVMNDRVMIPQEFVQSFRDLQGTTGKEHQFARLAFNTRPVQPLYSRVVLKKMNITNSKYVTTAEAVVGGHGTVIAVRFHTCHLPPSFDLSVTIPSLDINWKASNITSELKGLTILDVKQSYGITMDIHDHKYGKHENTMHVKVGIEESPTKKPDYIFNHYFEQCVIGNYKWLKPRVELMCTRQIVSSEKALSFTLSLKDACTDQYRLIVKKDTQVFLNTTTTEGNRVQLEMTDPQILSGASLQDWYFVLDIDKKSGVYNVKLYLEISHNTGKTLVMEGNFGTVLTCASPKGGTSHHIKLIVGVAVGIFIVLMVLLTVCLLWRRLRTKSGEPILVPQVEQDSAL